MSESCKLEEPDSEVKETTKLISAFKPIQPIILIEARSGDLSFFLKDVIDYSDTFPPDIEENILNERRFNKFKKEHTKELLHIILEQDFEYGFDSPADLFVRKLLKENRAITKEWLNLVFIDYFHDIRILIGLLQIISHIDYLDIYPQGPTMALATLNHVNSEVRESGIRAFENWGTFESLKVLQNVKCQEKWLDDYVQQVILDLEEKFSSHVSSH